MICRTVKLVLKKKKKALVITPGHCKRFSSHTTLSLFWGFKNEVEHIKEKLKKEFSQFHQPPPPSLFLGQQIAKSQHKNGPCNMLALPYGPYILKFCLKRWSPSGKIVTTLLPSNPNSPFSLP